MQERVSFFREVIKYVKKVVSSNLSFIENKETDIFFTQSIFKYFEKDRDSIQYFIEFILFLNKMNLVNICRSLLTSTLSLSSSSPSFTSK